MKKKKTHTHTPARWGIKLRMPWLGPSNGTTEHRHQTGKRKRKKKKKPNIYISTDTKPKTEFLIILKPMLTVIGTKPAELAGFF